MIRIVIVDDDPIVCQSLSLIAESQSKKEGLPIRVVAQGNDGKEAVSLYEAHRPDLLLMDIRMKDMDGLEACRLIREKDPEAKVLFLTTFLDDDYIIQALRLGARGYLVKSDVRGLLPAIYAIQEGSRVFGDAIAEKIPDLINHVPNRLEQRPFFHDLTEKEWELVEMVAQGKNNKEMAQALFLSEGTIRNYLSIILEKLDLRDRTQLAVAYYKEQ
ncbi:response regulator transcription factor [Kallipyga gabonensis]|uniref:response regulator transcription factor n=1 Tax=Kallipyga gabonensis TaxID=1686287 RepID=UPI000AE0D30C